MFDQSFTPKNLARIYHAENKKGVNIAGMFFPELIAHYDKIKRVRRLIRQFFLNRRFYKKKTFETRLLKFYTIRSDYKADKNLVIEERLDQVAKTINAKNFSFNITKLPYKKNGKEVYVTNGDAYSFFAEKQIQKNIKYTYAVKQADRDLIVPQLRAILSDEFPKFIIKTDIKSFYEKINRSLLISKLNENPILSLSTRKLIAKLLRDYDHLTGEDEGIPRGIGISAYLSELYLKDFDEKIRSIDNLIYYSRYVDDIVIVISPKPHESIEKYKKLVEQFASDDCLELNRAKTKPLTYKDKQSNYSFDYLGYKFTKSGPKLNLGISGKKKQKYQERIQLAIEKYIKSSKKQPVKAKKELLMRLNFLTTNTKLSNNKGNAVIGIYNTNKWVTEEKFLKDLDIFLQFQSRRIRSLST